MPSDRFFNERDWRLHFLCCCLEGDDPVSFEDLQYGAITSNQRRLMPDFMICLGKMSETHQLFLNSSGARVRPATAPD
jgi:hypothetical protein